MATWPLSDREQMSMLLVEQFVLNSPTADEGPNEEVDLHRYLIAFIGISTRDLCRMIATTIWDCAELGFSMKEMQGVIFLNSIIHEAVHDEAAIGFMPIMPWHDRPDDLPWLLMHSPPEGGVEVGLGDDEPWDPTMWQSHFPEEPAS